MKEAGCSRVTHPSATRFFRSKLPKNPVRLACLKHTASVRPEPESNSYVLILNSNRHLILTNKVCFLVCLFSRN